MLKKFAEELKENRLKKEITMQQLYARTRIDIKFLEAIENGNFGIMPDDVYLRAFIKSYATAVGLDENYALKKYDAAKAGHGVENKYATPEEFTSSKEEKPDDRVTEEKKDYKNLETARSYYSNDKASSSQNNLLYFVFACAVILIIILIYFVFIKGDANQIISEKPSEEYMENKLQRYVDSSDAKDNSSRKDSVLEVSEPTAFATEAQGDSLTLSITTSGKSWIKIKTDDKSVTEYNMKSDMAMTVRAKKKFQLVLGNSGVVQVQLNDNTLNLEGKLGEIRIVQVDSSGLVFSRTIKPTAKPQ
ncbi:MAG: RodZ domain-containing protein [Ignavibacteria bacterium]